MKRLALSLALFGAPFFAFGGATITVAPNGGSVVYGGSGVKAAVKSFVVEVFGPGSASLSDVLILPNPEPAVTGPAVKSTRVLNAARIAGQIGKIARLSGYVAVPLMLADAYIEYTQQGSVWGYYLDPGYKPFMEQQYCPDSIYKNVCGSTYDAMLSKVAAALQADAPPPSGRYQNTYTYYVGNNQSGQRTILYDQVTKDTESSWSQVQSGLEYGRPSATLKQVPTCPGSYLRRDGLCRAPSLIPATPKHLEDAVTSATPDKLKAAVQEIASSDPDAFDGVPATLAPAVPGQAVKVQAPPVTTTTTAADGTVRTETTTPTYSYTFGGNTYNYTTTNVTQASDGTKKETEVPPERVNPAVDTALPEIGEFYKTKYPDGVAGVWRSRSAEFKQTPLFGFLKQSVPTFGGGGGCMSLPVQFGSVFGVSVGGDISPPCWIWPICKSIFILFAALAARRIVFGG